MATPPMGSTSQLSDLISYPKPEPSTSDNPASINQAPRPKVQVRERLYVGNLHPTVSEYTLIQLFSRYGKLAKMDFLFHKSGPMKGKPRGYAFVEYASAENAEKALGALDQKLLQGRKISVTYANQAPDFSLSSRLRPTENKTTTLSLMKTPAKPKGTESKIAALEAKLRQMEQEKTLKAGGTQNAGTSGESSLPPRPAHLPRKPSTK